MKNPWETCDHYKGWNGFEGAIVKHGRGIWSDEVFFKWLNDHCERCPFFASGEACVYGDEDVMKAFKIDLKLKN